MDKVRETGHGQIVELGESSQVGLLYRFSVESVESDTLNNPPHVRHQNYYNEVVQKHLKE